MGKCLNIHVIIGHDGPSWQVNAHWISLIKYGTLTVCANRDCTLYFHIRDLLARFFNFKKKKQKKKQSFTPGQFERASVLFGCSILISNVALSAGSSKHGLKNVEIK